MLQAGDGGPGGDGTGGNEDVVRAILHAAHGHPARGRDSGVPPEEVHLFLLEQALHAGAEFLRHLRLPPVDGGEVHGDIFSGDAPLPAFFQGLDHLRGVEQALGGDAPPVQACPAHVPLLHNGGFHPQLGGA